MHCKLTLLSLCAGVVEVSDSESSDKEVADDDDGGEATYLKQPLLTNRQPAEGHHLSRQARKALKHLHAVDSNVRTVVSAVASSCTLNHNPTVIHRRRQDSISLWNRVRWWVIAAAVTFIILPVILVLFVKFVSPGSPGS